MKALRMEKNVEIEYICKKNDWPLSDVRSKPDLGKCRLEDDGGTLRTESSLFSCSVVCLQ